MFGCTEKIRRVANPICVVNKNIRHIVARRAPNACYLRSKDEMARNVLATLDFNSSSLLVIRLPLKHQKTFVMS